MSVEDRRDSAELELLLPWHVTGTLTKHEANSIELHRAVCPALARRLRQIQCERIDIVRLGESLGSPSDRPLARLLAAVGDHRASKRRTPRDEADTASFTGVSPHGSSGE